MPARKTRITHLTLFLAVNTPNRGLTGKNVFDNPRHSIIGSDFPFAA
jgi:hypothetical protein